MSYVVVVAQELEERFYERLGSLPQAVVDEVEDRLHALGENPRLARRVKAPWDGLLYAFSCRHQGKRYVFHFWAVYGQDEQTIVLVDMGFGLEHGPDLD